MKAFTMVVAAILLIGCKPAAEQKPAETEQQVSASVIDTMTQKSTIDAGRRTANKVHQIEANRQKDFEELMK